MWDRVAKRIENAREYVISGKVGGFNQEEEGKKGGEEQLLLGYDKTSGYQIGRLSILDKMLD